DSESLTNNNQLLDAFIEKINKSYQINEKSQEQASKMKDEQLAEMSRNIQSLEQASKMKDEQLAEMSRNIQSLEQASKMKDEQLAEMSPQNIQDLTSRLNDRELKLSSMEQSIVWQLTMKFHYKIVERLLPQNARRRNYYD